MSLSTRAEQAAPEEASITGQTFAIVEYYARWVNQKKLAEAAEGKREGIEEAAKGDSYAAWQQKRGMLADTVDWAILEYDEFMKDDAYDAQRVLDRIIERLRSTRSALAEKQP